MKDRNIKQVMLRRGASQRRMVYEVGEEDEIVDVSSIHV
jgi:hypothetical protein